jgi:hypothetical protein
MEVEIRDVSNARARGSFNQYWKNPGLIVKPGLWLMIQP